jgi:hypothetical protein
MDAIEVDAYTGKTIEELSRLIPWVPLGYGCLGTVDLVGESDDHLHYNLLIVVPWKLDGKGGGIRVLEELSTIPHPRPPDLEVATKDLMIELMRDEVLALVGEPIERREAEAFLHRLHHG